MQVVLNAKVANLGRRGDIVDVKPGYFRNFLYTHGLADVATPSRVKVAEDRKSKSADKKETALKDAESILAKLSGVQISIVKDANEKGHLYAGVTEEDVAEELEKTVKVEIATDFINMDHFKEVGSHEATVTIGEKSQKITVNVAAA